MTSFMLAQAANTTWWGTILQKDSLVAAVLLAILAACFKFYFDSAAERRKARLKFVNSQLKDFYGPLYAATTMSAVAWRAFRLKDWPDSTAGDDPHARKSDAALWYWWMTDIGMPIHESIVKIIHDRSDLIRGEQYDGSFVAYLQHVAEYRTIMPLWNKLDASKLSPGDRDKYFSADTSYPAQFVEDVRSAFLEARQEQQRLIRSTQDTLFARPRTPTSGATAERGGQLT